MIADRNDRTQTDIFCNWNEVATNKKGHVARPTEARRRV